MKISSSRAAFYGILGETIDIYQAEHAAASAFHHLGGRTGLRGNRQKVIVGHDASAASDMMEAAVCAALCAAGADVLTLGTVPSGAVSYLTAISGAVMGVMITGGSFDSDISGLKFYQSSGKPVHGDALQSIHATIDSHASLSSKQSGKIKRADASVLQRYRHNLLAAAGGNTFESMKAAVDCFQSAAQDFIQPLFEKMGIEVVLVEHDTEGDTAPVPSYLNNLALLDCIRDNQCDIGFAFNANAELCLVADSNGKVFDTERLAAVMARVYGSMSPQSSTSSIMLVSDNCHAALLPYMQSLHIDARSVTGDYSYLIDEWEALEASEKTENRLQMAVDPNQGILFPRWCAAPDGILTAIMLLNCLTQSGMTLNELSLEIPGLIRATSVISIPAGASLPDLRGTNLPDEIKILRSYLSGNGRVTIEKIDRSKVNIVVEGIKRKQVDDVTEKAERLVRKCFVVVSEKALETPPAPTPDKPAAPQSAAPKPTVPEERPAAVNMSNEKTEEHN